MIKKLIMTEEERKKEVIRDFTESLIREVENKVKEDGKENYIKGLE